MSPRADEIDAARELAELAAWFNSLASSNAARRAALARAIVRSAPIVCAPSRPFRVRFMWRKAGHDDR